MLLLCWWCWCCLCHWCCYCSCSLCCGTHHPSALAIITFIVLVIVVIIVVVVIVVIVTVVIVVCWPRPHLRFVWICPLACLVVPGVKV